MYQYGWFKLYIYIPIQSTNGIYLPTWMLDFLWFSCRVNIPVPCMVWDIYIYTSPQVPRRSVACPPTRPRWRRPRKAPRCGTGGWETAEVVGSSSGWVHWKGIPLHTRKLTSPLKRDSFSREYIWTNHWFSGDMLVFRGVPSIGNGIFTVPPRNLGFHSPAGSRETNG